MSQTYEDAARLVMERCDLLATFSEEQGRVTRRFASPPMRGVHEKLKNWLLAAGMSAEIDALGNLLGRRAAMQPGARTLLLGSHLDTVRDAGKYDGVLGVMIALVCLERLHERGERLPFALELLGFADEEGLRYQSVYMGSKAMSGTFQTRDLELRDAQGISMAEALRAFGCNPDPALLTRARWSREDLLGYCEVHIEQGPVLEARNLPLAVVTSIVGQQRMIFQFSGVPGHAGTLPMELRHDALCAAAEFVVAVETLARSVPGLVATVGQLEVQPGASNVVPGHVTLSLDIRHEDDDLRDRSANQLCGLAEQLCARRGIKCACQSVQRSATVACAPGLCQRWQEALSAEGYPIFTLASGAGHDGVALSALTEISMLFVRCQGGISHNRAEAVQELDVAAAIAVLERFLLLTAREVQQGQA
ncbi:MAG TPA: allantoate amidohydrolase [Ktedonobacteraceae bacterium]